MKTELQQIKKIRSLVKEMDAVELSFDKEKNVMFNIVFKNMKKVLEKLAELNKNHRDELRELSK